MITADNEILGREQRIRKEWWFETECEKVTTEKIQHKKRLYKGAEQEILRKNNIKCEG
jgi:hypothetical protein